MPGRNCRASNCSKTIWAFGLGSELRATTAKETVTACGPANRTVTASVTPPSPRPRGAGTVTVTVIAAGQRSCDSGVPAVQPSSDSESDVRPLRD